MELLREVSPPLFNGPRAAQTIRRMHTDCSASLRRLARAGNVRGPSCASRENRLSCTAALRGWKKMCPPKTSVKRSRSSGEKGSRGALEVGGRMAIVLRVARVGVVQGLPTYCTRVEGAKQGCQRSFGRQSVGRETVSPRGDGLTPAETCLRFQK